MSTTPAYPSTQLLIDGQWCDAADGRTLAVVNPANGTEIGRVAHAGKADLDRALEWAEDQLLGRGRFEDGPELAPQDMALFAGLDDDEAAIVIALLERHELVHGDAVFSEGDAGDRMYLIARGAVSIKLRLGDASRARLR